MLKKCKLGTKLLIAFLAVGIIPLAVIGAITLSKSSSAISDQVFRQLESMREVKQTQIETLFAGIQGNMSVLLETVKTLRREAFEKLKSVERIKKNQIEKYFNRARQDVVVLSNSVDAYNLYVLLRQYEIDEEIEANEPFLVDTYEYEELWNEKGKSLHDYMSVYGYSDVFLISANNGHVMYSAAKNSDIGTNLKSGPYKKQGLAALWRKVVATKSTQIQDFSLYTPAKRQPFAFIGAPINDLGGDIQAVAVLQISIGAVNEIMQEREGLGRTGETYLVGGDHLMRSDSIMDTESHSVVASFTNPDKGKVDTLASREALAGQTGAYVINDYNGDPVLSAYSPLAVEGLNWAIISEIDVAEAFSPVDPQGNEFFANVAQTNGYLDLYLMNPNGYCFYSVGKKSDFQTNLADGDYAQSGLGRLVQQVINTKQFGFADFEPYGPHNGDPAAFIAQPLINDDQVELVVAVLIPQATINSIMMERSGMGKTGETYLVGTDHLMRSDSFLDSTNHSVKASFADPKKGSVNTKAAEAAIAQQTGKMITTNYKGEKVLSAYMPMKVWDKTWALVAEMSTSEAFSAVSTIKWLIAMIALVGVVAIFVVAVAIARTIVNPVKGVVDGLTELSQGEGDLTLRLPVTGEDEVGVLAQRFNAFMEKLHSMITNIGSGVQTLSSSSTEMSTISQEMYQGADQAASKSDSVTKVVEEMSSNMLSISAAMDQSTNNTNMVASAAEEMSITINEIAKNAESARQVSNEAATQTSKISVEMNQLSQAANAIGKITETITEISEQVNLLALNATIEAARAGEAGKGFNVVATEIKELAKQTADATQNIKSQIEGIQGTTHITVKGIDEISKVINNVNEIVANIASAVEEQSMSTKEIAQNISQASQGIADVNGMVSESSSKAKEVTQSIAEVNVTSGKIADSSTYVKNSAADLSKLSEQLNEMVTRFKL